MAFTTLVLFSLFTVVNARSDEQSAFAGLFPNQWRWGAVLLSIVLQAAVIYVPFLQPAFSTAPLNAGIGSFARRWQARCSGCGS